MLSHVFFPHSWESPFVAFFYSINWITFTDEVKSPLHCFGKETIPYCRTQFSRQFSLDISKEKKVTDNGCFDKGRKWTFVWTLVSNTNKFYLIPHKHTSNSLNKVKGINYFKTHFLQKGKKIQLRLAAHLPWCPELLAALYGLKRYIEIKEMGKLKHAK